MPRRRGSSEGETCRELVARHQYLLLRPQAPLRSRGAARDALPRGPARLRHHGLRLAPAARSGVSPRRGCWPLGSSSCVPSRTAFSRLIRTRPTPTAISVRISRIQTYEELLSQEPEHAVALNSLAHLTLVSGKKGGATLAKQAAQRGVRHLDRRSVAVLGSDSGPVLPAGRGLGRQHDQRLRAGPPGASERASAHAGQA
jgi:hypothetical protein